MTALDVELRAAFRCSKAAARHDGIDWQLTFDEFYEWWTQEDRWSRRGRTAGRILHGATRRSRPVCSPQPCRDRAGGSDPVMAPPPRKASPNTSPRLP